MTTEARVLCSKWFDDLEVGETFETHGRTITELDLVGFGALTGDTNPQHLDRTFGERGPFGERVVHGALVLSYALALIPTDPDRLIALRGIDGVKFKSPTKVGDTIRVEGRVASCSEVSEEAGLLVLAVRIVNQHDRLVARARLEILTRREGAHGGARGSRFVREAGGGGRGEAVDRDTDETWSVDGWPDLPRALL